MVLIFIALVVFSSADTMPHTRSTLKKIERTQRAVALGFAPSSRGYCTAVIVPTSVSKAVTAASHSLALHKEHDNLANTVSHYGYTATQRAWKAGAISETMHKSSMSLHKMAGRLKHGISKKSFNRALCTKVQAN